MRDGVGPCQEWHEQQHQCQSEILIDSDQPSCWQKVMLSGGVEDQNPKTAGWLDKLQITLDADILVARGTGARRALACHHNF